MPPSTDFRLFLPKLRDFCREHAISVEERTLSLCEKHLQVLLKWNRVMNLVGDLSLQSAVERHYGEGLFLATFLPQGVDSVVDIGSGGGFPGVPLAAARSSISVTLIESRTKKAAFLRESTRDWPNVGVFCGLAASFAEAADWVCSRGVAADFVLEPAKARNAGLLLLVSTLDVPRLAETCEAFRYTTRSSELPWRKQASVFVATPEDGST